jgi:hypothetical protein
LAAILALPILTVDAQTGTLPMARPATPATATAITPVAPTAPTAPQLGLNPAGSSSAVNPAMPAAPAGALQPEQPDASALRAAPDVRRSRGDRTRSDERSRERRRLEGRD